LAAFSATFFFFHDRAYLKLLSGFRGQLGDSKTFCTYRLHLNLIKTKCVNLEIYYEKKLFYEPKTIKAYGIFLLA